MFVTFEGHQTFDQKRKTCLLFVCFVRLDSRVSNMFDARMRTTLAQRLVSIVSSVFDQTCFNRLATHFNLSMSGHQTMFDGVWSPNIYHLSRLLLLASWKEKKSHDYQRQPTQTLSVTQAIT